MVSMFAAGVSNILDSTGLIPMSACVDLERRSIGHKWKFSIISSSPIRAVEPLRIAYHEQASASNTISSAKVEAVLFFLFPATNASGGVSEPRKVWVNVCEERDRLNATAHGTIDIPISDISRC